MTPLAGTITNGIVVDVITIDAAGRLVVPKALRERLRLHAGARLEIHEEEGRLVLCPQRPGPRMVERRGLPAVDLGLGEAVDFDHGADREDRIGRLVDYALRR